MCIQQLHHVRSIRRLHAGKLGCLCCRSQSSLRWSSMQHSAVVVQAAILRSPIERTIIPRSRISIHNRFDMIFIQLCVFLNNNSNNNNPLLTITSATAATSGNIIERNGTKHHYSFHCDSYDPSPSIIIITTFYISIRCI